MALGGGLGLEGWRLVGGGGGMEGWRGGGRDGWQTGLSEIITSIRSHLPFPFCKGQRELNGEMTESTVCREAWVFLLGLAYEERYTWWNTRLMGKDTQKKHTNAHTHTHTHLLSVFVMAKQMVRWLRLRRQQSKGENNLTSETVNVSKNTAKQIVQIIKSLMEYPWLAICHIFLH